MREEIIASFDYSVEITEEDLYRKIDQVIVRESKENFLTLPKKEQLRKELFAAIRGLDILEEVLEQDSVTEIMINGAEHIFLEEYGKIHRWDKKFESKQKLEDIIQQIVAKANRIVNEASPIVDTRLEDGSRVNVILPPVALNGPIVTIRKFAKEPFTMDKLIEIGSITKDAAQFLEKLVQAKYNIFICGGTGSGKTTFLNALTAYIPKQERIITIEDAAELRLKQKHVISLETRLTNYEGEGEVTIRDLVRNSLRMRPDRIIVGEVRGKEAFDMLQAMNTGHDGSLTTIHANGPQDSLNRLETLVLMSGMEIPVKAIREYIENAIDLVVQIERLSDGRRKITNISEIVGFKNDEIRLKEIFAFRQNGLTSNNLVDGEFVLYNYVPKSYEKIVRKGITSIDDIFEVILRNRGK